MSAEEKEAQAKVKASEKLLKAAKNDERSNAEGCVAKGADVNFANEVRAAPFQRLLPCLTSRHVSVNKPLDRVMIPRSHRLHLRSTAKLQRTWQRRTGRLTFFAICARKMPTSHWRTR